MAISPVINLAILAKAPLPGFAKTRLIPTLGAHAAAALQAWLLQRTLATAQQASLGQVCLWCAPDTQHPLFQAAGVTLRAQPEGDLGQRMYYAAEQAAAPVVLIGTDCPALTAAHLQQAAQALQHHPAVLIPAEDGGYVLLGLQRPDITLFSAMAWGSADVAALTRARLKALHWRYHELPPLWDVDRAADVARLQQLFPHWQGEGNDYLSR